MMHSTKLYSEIFTGALNRYGKLTYWNEVTGEKDLYEEKRPIPIEDHLSRKEYLGRSPVNEETQMCDWLGIDIDIKFNARGFCSKVWSELGTQYFPFMTLNKRWRIIEFLDEPMDVKLVHQRAKELQERIKKELGIETDDKATTPTIPGDEKAVGRWLFLPYGCDYDTCYSPSGKPLTINQFFFRHKYRNHPIVIAGIGIGGGGKDGSRGNHLYYVELYKKHFDCDVELKEINQNYGTPLDADGPFSKFEKEQKHILKSVEKDNYNKEYFLNGAPGWMKDTCGFKPYLDAKGFSAITSAITDNHIYVQARTDFYEKDTNQFKSKEQINDWWQSKIKGKKSMTGELLSNADLVKVRSYLTHPGLPPGVVSITRGMIKGTSEGDYLNIYDDPQIIPNNNIEWKRFDEYYSFLLGPDNWMIEKQKLAFCLRAKEELYELGIKVQWFSIWHSVVQGVGKGLFSQVVQSLFGYRNVAPNVKFKDMVGNHTTIIEGKQIIFLNEVVLENNTAKTKVLSNEFKDLITEPVLWINPKNKPQIEIPNLCNFWVFSNSDTPLYIEDDDRRAFVINIKHSKQTINYKLIEEGYKNDILKVIDDPSGFKHHLLNDITYDRDMFFNDAPFTHDKQELIDSNKSEFLQEMEARHEAMEFPFGYRDEVKMIGMTNDHLFTWHYRGMLNKLKLRQMLKQSEDFKGVFISLNDIDIVLKKLSTKWPNGEWTKQIVLSSGKRIRVYCTHPLSFEGDYITELTEGELGELYENTDMNLRFR